MSEGPMSLLHADGLRAWLADRLQCSPAEIADGESLIELGLDSLSVMRVPGLLAACGVTVKVSELMAAPTLAAWYALIASRLPETVKAEAAPQVMAQRDRFPLTDVQRAYWLGRTSLFELGGVAAHGYLELACTDLDPQALERALDATVAHHPMLRMVVGEDGMQHILPEVPPYRIACAQGLAAALATRAEMRQAVLPADRWPLFDIRLTRLEDGDWRLHVGFDVLAVDLASLDLWLRDWYRLYRQPAALLDQPATHFSQYVARLEQRRASPEGLRARQWWEERLPTLPPCPDLPLACDPATIRAPQFERLAHVIPAEQWYSLKALAAKAQVTPSALMLTALAEVLAQWSRSAHFTLNLTLFNRDNSGLDVSGVVGDFTSLLLVEADLRQPQPFAERAIRLQDEVWRGVDHAVISGVEVIGRLAELRHQQGRAIMPVVFTSAIGAGSYLDAVAGFGTVVDASNQTPQVWLDVQAVDHDGGVMLIWDSVAGLFPPALLAAMLAAQVRLLESLTETAAWEAMVPALLPAAQVEQRLRVNSTAQDLPANRLLQAPFLHQARLTPDAPALITPDRTLTYGELERASARLAAQVMQAGSAPDRLVAVVLPRGWQQVVAVLAILRAGAAYLPLEAGLPPARLAALLAQGECALALVAEGVTPELPPTIATLPVGAALLAEGPVPLVSCPASPDHLAYVIFTSGSTGVPKGVMIDHRAALNTVLDINARYGVTAADRVLSVSSLGFDLSVYDLFGVLAAGGAVVLPRPSASPEPAHWLEMLHAHRVTLWNSVPALFRLLLEQADSATGRQAVQALRLVMTSGDWLPVALARQILAEPGERQVVSLGGATEAAIWSIAHRLHEVPADWASIPYGLPLANQRFHVLDHALRPRPDWVAGELYIAGAGLARGYWRDGLRTARAFLRHPHSGERLYRTGDLGRMLPSGEIEFLGRDDDQVKVNGLRIELGEIELALTQQPMIETAALTVVRSPRGDRLAAFVVTAGAAEIDVPALRQALQQVLPASWVPSSIERLAALPLTGNGKIDRAALTRLADQRQTEQIVVPLPPTNRLEQQVAEVWQRLLDAPVASIEQSFFDAGGTSLQATRLAGELSALVGRTVGVVALFAHPTIAAQARFLAAADADHAGSPSGAQERAGSSSGAQERAGSSSGAQERAGTRRGLQAAVFQARRERAVTGG